jgi:hypothetical protein
MVTPAIMDIKKRLLNCHMIYLSVIISHQTLAQNSNAVAGMTAFLRTPSF